jgi:Tfp pilus assembly protein PilE
MFKQAKGITLVSLVITIIVMLILAGVSLSMVMGENSVLDQATQAVDETERGTVKDEISMGVGAIQTKYFAQYSSTTDRKSMYEILMGGEHNEKSGIVLSDFANAESVELFPKSDKSEVLLKYTHTNDNVYEAVITVGQTSLTVGETVCVSRASGGTSGVGNSVLNVANTVYNTTAESSVAR